MTELVQRKQKDLYLIGALILSSVLLAINLCFPMNLDNNIYQEMGMMLARFGKLPYLGSWDVNFPGIVYVHALAITLFGNNDIGFKIIDTLTRLVTVILLYRCTERLSTKPVAFLATAFYTLHYLSGYYWLTGQRDEFAVVFILLGALLILKYEGGARGNLIIILITVCLNIAALFRPTYFLFLLSGFIILVLIDRGKWRSILFATALTTVSLWLLVLLPYFFIPGALKEVYLATIRFNLDLYVGLHNYFIPTVLFIGSRRTLLLLSLLIFIPPYKIKEKTLITPERWLLILFFLSGMISLLSMRKYFSYHWEPVMTMAAAFSAVGVWKASSYLRNPILRTSIIVLGICLFAYRTYPWKLAESAIQAIKENESPTHRLYTILESDSLYGYRAQEQVINRINAVSSRNEVIECMVIDPGIRWRLNRDEATRFTRLLAVGMKRSDGEYTDYQKRWQQEYMDSLNHIVPKHIILAKGPKVALDYIRNSPDSILNSLPGFDSFLVQHYILDTTVGGYTIYQRNTN